VCVLEGVHRMLNSAGVH